MYKWKQSERDLIKKKIEYYRKRLNLHGWKFDITFSVNNKYEKWRNSMAEIVSDTIYQRWSVEIFPLLMTISRKHWKHMIDEAICHELAHCLTEWISNIASSRFLQESEIEEEIEVLTQKIAIIVQNNELCHVTVTRGDKVSKSVEKHK